MPTSDKAHRWADTPTPTSTDTLPPEGGAESEGGGGGIDERRIDFLPIATQTEAVRHRDGAGESAYCDGKGEEGK